MVPFAQVESGLSSCDMSKFLYLELKSGFGGWSDPLKAVYIVYVPTMKPPCDAWLA